MATKKEVEAGTGTESKTEQAAEDKEMLTLDKFEEASEIVKKVTLETKLVFSDLHQIQEQMRNRPNNGLIDFELQKKMNEKNSKRNPLINEVEIDVAGKSIEEVLEQSINIIEITPPCFDYEYAKSSKEMFYSWVFANGLR